MFSKNASLLSQSDLEALYNGAVLPHGVSLTEHGVFHQVSTKDGKARDVRLGDSFAFIAHFDMPDGKVQVGMAFPNHKGEVVLVLVPKSDIQTQLALDELADAGWTASMQKGLRSRFCDMYASVASCLPRYTVVARNGMQPDEQSFVMDGYTLGSKQERRVLPPENYLGITRGGTLTSWQEDVAAPCEDEPFLLMSICMGFAAPIKHVVLQQGAVLNFIGRTSTGKTTSVIVGASVFIDPSHGVRSWDATEPGIDQMIERYSGFLLPIDEILAGMNPKQHVALLHRLGAQKTKQKARGFGGGVQALVLALSTEEYDLSIRRSEVAQGGAAARFFDIPIGNGAGGIFRTVATAKDGAALSKRLAQAARMNFGTALPAFIDGAFERDWKSILSTYFSSMQQALAAEDHDAITLRGLDVFATIAAAGLLACDMGITPWKHQSVINACEVVFDHWLRRNEFLGRNKSNSDPAERFAAVAAAEDLRSKLLGAVGVPIQTLSELRATGMTLAPSEPACPTFMYSRDGEQAVCIGQARFFELMGSRARLDLLTLKRGGLLMINGNGDGYKLTVTVAPKETAQFIAIRV